MDVLVSGDALTPRNRLFSPAGVVIRAKAVGELRTATQTVAAAEAQAQRIRSQSQQAYEAAMKKGYEDGQERSRAECARQLALLTGRSDAFMAQVESQLGTLVMQAMRKIVEDFDDRERLVHAVRNALSTVRNQRQLTLKVHPEQVDHARAQVDTLIEPYPAIELVDVIGEPALPPDECLLESAIGTVQASLDIQIAALEAALPQPGRERD